jgi:putative Mn2+ efflux pump MntP
VRSAPLYRGLTLLYPREFRHRYRDDLIQHHADLTRDRGRAAAWSRSGLDLIVTVPRYHLETAMNPHHTTGALNVIVAALGIAGLMAIVAVDSYIGAALLAVAAVLAVSQRSQLARAIRVRDSDRRRHRLKMAAFFAVVTVADVAIASADLPNDYSWGTKAVIYGAVSFAAAGATICYLIAGLLTRKSTQHMITESAMP